MALQLEEFNDDNQYKPVKVNANADALSPNTVLSFKFSKNVVSETYEEFIRFTKIYLM